MGAAARLLKLSGAHLKGRLMALLGARRQLHRQHATGTGGSAPCRAYED